VRKDDRRNRAEQGNGVGAFDFGFLPVTPGGDGGQFDVPALMDEPALPGCLLPGRLISLIKAGRTEDGETSHNRVRRETSARPSLGTDEAAPMISPAPVLPQGHGFQFCLSLGAKFVDTCT
jgi:hypothetical protein